MPIALGAKDDWDFQISDLVKKPNRTDHRYGREVTSLPLTKQA